MKFRNRCSKFRKSSERTNKVAIKISYKDIIPAGRFALCVIFITINPFYLDVNVSPTKSEIRFRDTNYIQKFISDSIKKNLSKFDRISLTVDNNKLGFKEDVTYIKQDNFDYTNIKPSNDKMQLNDITYDKSYVKLNDTDYNKNHDNNITTKQKNISNLVNIDNN